MKLFNPEAEKAGPAQERPPSHLKEGVPAIMACVGTPDNFRLNPGAEKFAFYEDVSDIPGAHNVDYRGNPSNLERNNFKNSGRYSYVISPVDALDKFSKDFYDCTGLVATGYDKKTGENMSLLSHEDPSYFLKYETSFLADLGQRLTELKEKCAEGTIDAAIIGGKYPDSGDTKDARDLREDYKDARDLREDYLASIKLLSGEVSKILGFEPIVITGPKGIPGSDNIFYENKSRRLYISRPEVGNETTESFKPSDLKKQKKKW